MIFSSDSGIFCFLLVYFVFNTSGRAGMEVYDHTLSGKKSGRKIIIFHDENPFSKFKIEKKMTKF